jgi:hypothetical protein
MEKEKDNVYEEKNGTEQGMEERTDAEKVRADGGSTGLGKFKDVDALAKAYSALEAEFTRRSQKLRELERMADKFQNAFSEGGSGAEKLRERAKERREEANKFDEFLREGVKNAAPLVDGNPDVEGSAQEDTEHSSVAAAVGLEKDVKAAAAEKSVEWTADENSQTTAKIAVGVSEMEKTRLPVAEGVDGRIPTEELYRMATKNEKVRLQIIGEYLHSLGKTSAPITAGGVGALATPPRSIRNIQDAGKMALQLFQK